MRSTLLLLAAIALTVALGYPDVAFQSVHPPGDDDLEFVVPFSLELRAALAEGRLPLWNPHIDGGVSFFARFPYLEPFYPTVALFLALPERVALDASLFLHLFMAGAGLAFLLRTLGARPLAAGVGALVYVQSSAFRANVGEGYLTALVAFTWLPWLLAAIHRIAGAEAREELVRWTALAAGALGLMLLGGQPTDLLASALMTAVVLAVLFVRREHRARAVQALVACAALVVGGVALGAAFWWPASQAIALAGGAPELPMKTARGGALTDLLTYGLPHGAWGSSSDRHVNFAALALAAMACWTVRQRPRAWPFLALGGLSFVLSLGQATPLWSLLRATLPLFHAVDTSVAYISGFVLAVAVLAGLVFDSLPSRRVAAVLGGLLLLDAAVYQAPAWTRMSHAIPERPAAAETVERFLVERAGEGRMLELEMFLPEEMLLFQRNHAMSLGIENLRLSSHFPSRRTVELLAHLDGVLVDWRDFSDTRERNLGKEGAVLEDTNARILDLFGVRWLVTDFEVPGATAPTVEALPWRIYERSSAWQRARWLHPDLVLPEEDCVAHLLAPDFDPAKAPEGRARVELVERGAARRVFRVETEAPGLLWIGETFDPGWHATIDGEAVETRVAHCAFLGVPVESGAHEVEIRFTPRGLRPGLLLSGLALAAILLAILRPGRRPPPPRP